MKVYIKFQVKSGIFGTGGDTIGIEDVFKTLTTGKEGEKSLKKSQQFMQHQLLLRRLNKPLRRLGIPADSLNQDEYNRVKASLTGDQFLLTQQAEEWDVHLELP